MTVTHGPLRLDWLGYATLSLEAGNTVVYLDPGR
jgi:L-ascorbate metabolism protein UlaG (beta-lactamase superfamily)